MAFAAYLLEKAILVTSRGRTFASLLKPRRVVFLWAARPQRGAFAAFQIKKKKRKVQQMPKGGSRTGMLAIDWAIIELHNDQSNSTCKNWSENISIQRRFLERRQTPCFYYIFLVYSYTKNRENLITSSRSYSLSNVWIDWPLMPSSDVTTPLL